MSQALAGVSVLVADDDLDNAELLELLLSSRGAEVRLANDGAAALALLDRFRPQVMLLDITLPDTSGYDLLQRMRALSGLERVHAVAVTGHAHERDRARALEAGFSAHVVKPIDAEALVQLLTKLGSPAQPHAEP